MWSCPEWLRNASLWSSIKLPEPPRITPAEQAFQQKIQSFEIVMGACNVVNSLGLLHVKQAVQQVEECLHDPHPIIVQAAILAMARIDPERIKGRLAGFFQSEDYLVHLKPEFC